MEGDGGDIIAIVQGLDDAGMTLTVTNRHQDPVGNRKNRSSCKAKHNININDLQALEGLDKRIPMMTPTHMNQSTNHHSPVHQSTVHQSTMHSPTRHPKNMHPSEMHPMIMYPSQMHGSPHHSPRMHSKSTDPPQINSTSHPPPVQLRSRHSSPMHRSNLHPSTLCPLQQQCSTETSADFSPKATTGAQICDGRYASSYRLAHCKVTPTSPPERVTEFPPQRSEPSRNFGNFEIGSHGSSSLREVRESAAKSRYPRATVNWGDSGLKINNRSVYHNKSSRGVDAFVHSLRKYPSITRSGPFRSLSTDIIEKLIRHTQAKNSSRSSQRTKSMRSLHKDSDLHRTSKHQQTYTRLQRGLSNESEVNLNTIQLGYKSRSRNFKLYSPMSESRNLKYSESPYSNNYDYLKASSSRRSVQQDRPERLARQDRPTRQDRHERALRLNRSLLLERPDLIERANHLDRSIQDMRLHDMSKYLRSTIRQIYADKQVVLQVCPKMMKRFNQHKKNTCPNRNEEPQTSEADNQASVPALSRFLASFSGCGLPAKASAFETCSSKLNWNLTKASQCNCQADTISICTSAQLLQTNPRPMKSTYCECSPHTVEHASQESPIFSKVSICVSADSQIFERPEPEGPICTDDYYIIHLNRRIDEEIAEWLKEVPVFSNDNLQNKLERERMIRRLENAIKQLSDDVDFNEHAREEIETFIKDFPMWSHGTQEEQEAFRLQMADILLNKIKAIKRQPDRIRDIVKCWVKHSCIGLTKLLKDVDTESVIDDFTISIKTMAAVRPKSDKVYFDNLKNEIIEKLNRLPLRVPCNKEVILNHLANKLASEIVKAPRDLILTNEINDVSEEFEIDIAEWLEELTRFRDNIKELKADPKLIEQLSKKLNVLQSEGIDEKGIRDKMNEEIQKFMADLDITIDTLDELIEDLMDQLSKTVQDNALNNLEQDDLTEEIVDWLRDNPNITDMHPRKFEQIVQDLTSKIRHGEYQNRDDYSNDIVDYLAHSGINANPVVLGNRIKELLKILDSWPSNKQYKENSKQNILKEFENIIDNEPIPNQIKNNLKSKILDMANNNLNTSSLDYEKDQDEVRRALFEGIDEIVETCPVSQDRRDRLKHKLNDALETNFDKLFSGVKKDGTDFKRAIKRDFNSVIKNLPIDPDEKKAVMQKVKDILVRNLDKPLPDNLQDTLTESINEIVDDVAEDPSTIDNLKHRISVAVESVFDELPAPCKYICDIKDLLSRDFCKIIDKFCFDKDKKKELKQNTKDVLYANKREPLSDDVKSKIKREIISVIDDFAISRDNKNLLKTAIDDTASKRFDTALSSMKVDINKLKSSLSKNINSAIDKSPINTAKKFDLKNKIKGLVNQNLDSTISNDDRDVILDALLHDLNFAALPKEKRKHLRNKLAKTLDTKINSARPDRKFKEDAIEQEIISLIDDAPIPEIKKENLKILLKDALKNNIDDSLPDIIMELYDNIEESSIPKDKKANFKAKLTNVVVKYNIALPIEEEDEVDNFYKTVIDETFNVINNLSLDDHEKRDLQDMIRNMLSKKLYRPLSEEVKKCINKDISDIIHDVPIPKENKSEIQTKLSSILQNDLEKLSNQDKNISNVKDSIIKDVHNIIDGLHISTVKRNDLIKKVKGALSDNLDRTLTKERKMAIRVELNHILDGLAIPEQEQHGLKDEIKKIIKKGKKVHLTGDKIKDVITKEMDQAIDSLTIDPDKKKSLKTNVGLKLTETLFQPISEKYKKRVEHDMIDIIDDLNLPNDEKNVLKSTIKEKLLESLGTPITSHTDVNEVKNLTNRNINKIIEELSLPEYQKSLLKKKTNHVLNDHLAKLVSKTVKCGVKEGLRNIIDSTAISNEDKKELKENVTSIVNKNIDKMQIHAECISEAQEKMFQGIENIIEESNLRKPQKKQLKHELKMLVAENLKENISDDIKNELKKDIKNILDEMAIPEEEKNCLKTELNEMVDKNLNTLIKDLNTPLTEIKDKKVKDRILQELEKNIEEAPISAELKRDLKRQLKDLAENNLDKPFSTDVQNAFKEGIANILNKLPLQEDEIKQLENAMVSSINKNIESIQEDELEHQDKLKARTQERILNRMSKAIEESSLSPEKKKELYEKFKQIAAQSLNDPLSDDAKIMLKEGIESILDEIPISAEKKSKLRGELTDMAVEDMDTLYNDINASLGKKIDIGKGARRLTLKESEIKHKILDGIEKTINELQIPEEKKQELRKKLKKMVAENMKKPLSFDVQESIKDGIRAILSDMPMTSNEKLELENTLTDLVDDKMEPLYVKENVAKLGEKIKSPTQERVLRDTKDTIDKSSILESIPEEESISKDKKSEISDDVDNNVEILKKDIKKEQKTSLSLQSSQTKDKILWEIEKAIEESPIPEEKKRELRKKLNKIATDNFNKPLSINIQDDLKDGIYSILDELPMSKEKKNNMKSEMQDMIDKYMFNLYEDVDEVMNEKDITEIEKLERQTQKNILKGIEDTIDQYDLPQEKKDELKKKLKELASDKFKYPLSSDVQNMLKNDINMILDELPVPKDMKNRLKMDLTGVVDNNMESLGKDIEDKDDRQFKKIQTSAKDSILQGTEDIIEQATIPLEQKEELKEKSIKMTNENLHVPFPHGVQDILKDGFNSILDKTPIPKDQKNKLINDYSEMVDDNIENLHYDMKKINDLKITRNNRASVAKAEILLQDEIMKGIEKCVENAPISEEEKVELKKKLIAMAKENVNNQLPIDLQKAIKSGMNDILDNMPITREEKNKLKSELNHMADEVMEPLRIEQKEKEAKRVELLKNETENSLLEGIVETIDQSTIPEHKKQELKEKLKQMAADNLRKPLSGDTKNMLKDGINDILNELHLAPDEKNQLRKNLTDMVNKKTEPLRNDIAIAKQRELLRAHTQSNIFKEIEDSIDKAPISAEQKKEYKDRLKKIAADNLIDPSLATQNLMKGRISTLLNELPLSKDDKRQLKDNLNDKVDANMNNLRDDIENQPVKYLKRKSRPTTEDEVKENILKGIEKSIDEAPIPEEKKRELKMKLNDMASEHFKQPFSRYTEDIIRGGIFEILDDIPLSKEKKDELKYNLNDMLDINMEALRVIEKTHEQSMKLDESLLEEMADIFHNENVDSRDLQNLDVADELKDLILRGGDIDDAQYNIKQRIMQDLGVSEDKAEDISQKLVRRAREMTLAAKHNDIDDKEIFKQEQDRRPSRKLIDLTDKEFLESPERLKLKEDDRFAHDTTEIKVFDIKKPSILEKITGTINDVLDKSNLPDSLQSNLNSQIKQKLKENVEKSPLNNRQEVEELKIALLEDIKNIIDNTDLPCDKGALFHKFKEALVEDFDDIKQMTGTVDISGLKPAETSTGEYSKKPYSKKSPTAKEYIDKLFAAIHEWENHLPIKLEPSVKETFSRDIANDILDRQKYLQLNPSVKSYENEIENLKYQVFRRLCRIMDPVTVSGIIETSEQWLSNVIHLNLPDVLPKHFQGL